MHSYAIVCNLKDVGANPWTKSVAASGTVRGKIICECFVKSNQMAGCLGVFLVLGCGNFH